MKPLDPNLRARLRSLSDEAYADEAHAGEADVNRDIGSMMADMGPIHVARARRVMQIQRGAAVAVVACAALAVGIWSHDWNGSSSEAPRRQAANSAGDAARCAQREPGVPGDVTGRQDWEHVAFAPGLRAALRVTAAEPCRTVLTLDHGSVAVHARDLGGGELIVETPRGNVHVRGTTFEVRVDDELVVAVAEGRVEVDGNGASPIVIEGPGRWRSGEAAQSPFDGSFLEARVQRWTEEGNSRGQVTNSPDETDADEVVVDGDFVGETGDDAAEDASMSESTSESADDTFAPRSSTPRRRGDADVTVESLVQRAERSRRDGDLEEARVLYRRAGLRRGATAESAWIRLARLELDTRRPVAARRALAAHRRRGQVHFAPEAAWLEVLAFEMVERSEAARRAAERLVRRHPSSPQADAGRRWLADHAESED